MCFHFPSFVTHRNKFYFCFLRIGVVTLKRFVLRSNGLDHEGTRAAVERGNKYGYAFNCSKASSIPIWLGPVLTVCRNEINFYLFQNYFSGYFLSLYCLRFYVHLLKIVKFFIVLFFIIILL